MVISVAREHPLIIIMLHLAHLGDQVGIVNQLLWRVSAGDDDLNSAILAKYNNLRKNVSREEEQLETLNKEKERLREVGGGDRQLMQWKVKINAAAATKEARIKELMDEMKALTVEINKGNGAKAVITEMAYANTIFVISGIIYRLEQDRRTYDQMIFKADARRENIVVI